MQSLPKSGMIAVLSSRNKETEDCFMAELNCEKLCFPSSDGKHTVAAYLYTVPGVALKGVIQLSHGMCEYVERYRDYAAYFASRGFAFAGNDHLGHGGTVSKAEYGQYQRAENLLEDLHTMNGLLHKRFAGLPLILYGHSMGSFYARWYAERYGETIDGLIISGTAGPSALNNVGKVIAGMIAAVRGPAYVSPFMVKLNFGSYNKRFADEASPNAWLSRDRAVVQAYDADEKCAFQFAAATYREMLRALTHVSSKKWAAALRRDLPILLIAGAQDPVGNYGEGVRQVYAMLGDAGIEDLTCQIDPDGRHELHNELNRAEIEEYVLGWLEDHWGVPAQQ